MTQHPFAQLGLSGPRVGHSGDRCRLRTIKLKVQSFGILVLNLIKIEAFCDPGLKVFYLPKHQFPK